MSLLKVLKTAEKLYEARDTMRSLLGDRYVERCTFWVGRINVVMQRQGCDELAAGMALAKEMEADKGGGSPAVLFATVVEMIEGIFALPKVGETVKYRSTSRAHPGKVAEGKAEVVQYLTAAKAPAPHMRPEERMLYVRGCDHGRMHGQHFLIKSSEVVRS